MGQGELSRILSRLGASDHEVHELVDNIILAKHVLVFNHQRQDIAIAADIALAFARDSLAHV